MVQQILVVLVFIAAVAFLVKKFFWKSKKKDTKSCGKDGVDCGCH